MSKFIEHFTTVLCSLYSADGFLSVSYSFSDNGVEVAETAYAVALAYANVGDEDAESMLFICGS